MTARDELFKLASQDMPVSWAEVEAAIDAYAHELAEQVRNYDGFGKEDAADYIDPEVV